MKILFIYHSSNLGGPAYSLLNLVPYLSLEYDVEIAVRAEGEFTRLLREKGIKYIVFPFSWLNLPRLVLFILRTRYDLIYGNNISGPSSLALLAARITSKPFIWHIREMITDDHPSPGMKKRLDYATRIIAVSESCAASVRPYLSHDTISVIPNGIDVGEYSGDAKKARQELISKLGVADNSLLVLVIGNVCRRKNQMDVIEVAQQLVPRYTFVHFCFLGNLQEESYIAQINELVNQHNLEEHVHFLGFIPNISSLSIGGDVFLHLPVKDPHPRAVIEGMASRLPVVAYSVDGIKETVIDKKTGFLVPFNDLEKAAIALETLIKDRVLRKKMGEFGYERARDHYTAAKTAQSVLGVIHSVLDRKQ